MGDKKQRAGWDQQLELFLIIIWILPIFTFGASLAKKRAILGSKKILLKAVVVVLCFSVSILGAMSSDSTALTILAIESCLLILCLCGLLFKRAANPIVEIESLIIHLIQKGDPEALSNFVGEVKDELRNNDTIREIPARPFDFIFESVTLAYTKTLPKFVSDPRSALIVFLWCFFWAIFLTIFLFAVILKCFSASAEAYDFYYYLTVSLQRFINVEIVEVAKGSFMPWIHVFESIISYFYLVIALMAFSSSLQHTSDNIRDYSSKLLNLQHDRFLNKR